MSIRLEQVQRQTQKLIMSPQMQQAFHLLQLPLMELSTLIQQEMVDNPILEEVTNQNEAVAETKDEEPEPEVDFDDEFGHLAQLDDEWREYYRQSGSFVRTSDDEERRRRFYEESIATQETLQEHLLKQWSLFARSQDERPIGDMIIGNIDENGYLSISIEELSQSSGISLGDLERILQIIQTFHPVGVGARSLKECLLIQLNRLGKQDSLEAKIVLGHIDELGRKNYANIARVFNIPVTDVYKAAEIIATLEPKPGRIFDQERTHYATPDVFVEKVGDEYVVVLNDDRLPHLRISNLYRGLMKDKGVESETRNYIRGKVQAGKWLVRNIQLRQQTIYNIAKTIVREQQDFFENGVSALKPLTMQQVAVQIGMHESTVSRAIASKYMATPRGLFQMKYFFTPGLITQTGENMSTANIKEILGDLINKEDPQKPSSDQEMVEIFKARGINVARRTITKYRKELRILPSNLRKKY